MSPDTFTPGPWSIKTDADGGYAFVEILGANKMQVAQLESADGFEAMTGADARLIAAAPDLLASLTDAAIRCAGRRREKFREHRCVDCSKWLDVIGKAVGP